MAVNVIRVVFIIVALLLSCRSYAAVFELPTDGSNMVGEIQVVRVAGENTLLDVARHFDLGHHEITLANPGVDLWVPQPAERVVVPTQFILPPKPWKGVVINIPQRRLFYFPPPAEGEAAKVVTFPVGIAREGWKTPLGTTTIKNKHRDPAWMVPASIRAEHRQEYGTELPAYFPPGPDNPMGMLAVETRFPGIFIHGTNRPWGVGMRVSHGCLHLYPEDAQTFFGMIAPDTPLRILNEPVRIGARGDALYVARYEPLPEYPASGASLSRAVMSHLASVPAETATAYDIDWERIQHLARQQRPGPVVPTPVVNNVPRLEEWLAGLPVERYDLAPYGKDANNAQVPQRHQPKERAQRESQPPSQSG